MLLRRTCHIVRMYSRSRLRTFLYFLHRADRYLFSRFGRSLYGHAGSRRRYTGTYGCRSFYSLHSGRLSYLLCSLRTGACRM